MSRATRLIDSLFRTLTRFGLGASYRRILTVLGRKTGRLYSTPVDVLELDGQRWQVDSFKCLRLGRDARERLDAALPGRQLRLAA